MRREIKSIAVKQQERTKRKNPRSAKKKEDRRE